MDPSSLSAVLGASEAASSSAIFSSLSGASVMFFYIFFGVGGIFEILIEFSKLIWEYF